MTRINCIPPSELSDAHLGAEYRELPRVFAQAFAAHERGVQAASLPKQYALGKGHVQFFFNKLSFLRRRHAALVAECRARGRAVNFPVAPNCADGLPAAWWQDWAPDNAALEANRARIAERLNQQSTTKE